MSTKPKDGTTKKRKGVKAMTVTRWVNWYLGEPSCNLFEIESRVTIKPPATGIIKKARK